MADIKLNSIEDAVKDFQKGKFVIVVDDEDRENEGDLIIAAEKIDAEKVNFMLKNARGVLCAPITLSRCEELDLPHQVSDNTSMLGTPCSSASRIVARLSLPKEQDAICRVFFFSFEIMIILSDSVFAGSIVSRWGVCYNSAYHFQSF